jgi:hypothetical protein
MLGRAGQLEDSVEWFEVCLEWTEPEQRYTPLHNLALTLMLMGRFSDALPHAQEALELAQVRGGGRLQGPVISLAVAALQADEAQLERVADLALFSVRQEQPPDTSLWLKLLEEAQPRRATSRVWVDAMTHALRAHSSHAQEPDRSPESPEESASPEDARPTFVFNADGATLAEWADD